MGKPITWQNPYIMSFAMVYGFCHRSMAKPMGYPIPAWTRGDGHCGIGAYVAVAQCEKCSIFGGCQEPQPTVNLSPPANLPVEEVFLGQTTFLTAPIAALGMLTSSERVGLSASQCPARRPCKIRCGVRCQRRGGFPGLQCCRPVGGRGQRVYCPRRGSFCT